MEVRPRQRTEVPAVLIQKYEGQIASLKASFTELRGENRILRRQLSRYQSAPPIFPQAMLDQIKKLRAFGVSEAQLQQSYGIDAERVERILNDMEMPLIAFRRAS